MEDEVCMFSKFGYCRYKERCKRKHYKEVCKQDESCQAIKTCTKRHPKKCKKNETERGCRFGIECSYHYNTEHDVPKAGETKNYLAWKEKVNILENSVAKL